MSEYGGTKGKTKSMTPNLIPRSVHHPMKQSGQFSTHMSLQTDHGHYQHTRSVVNRPHMPDHRSWVSNSHINKRFYGRKNDRAKFGRISDSHDDPSLYRYGGRKNFQYPDSSRNSEFNPSLAESTKPLQARDASHLQMKQGIYHTADHGRNPAPRQTLGRIKENDDEHYYYFVEGENGEKRKVLKKSAGRDSNSQGKDQRSDVGQTRLSKNKISREDYFVDPETGKKYFLRKNSGTNQQIFYVDPQTGKKIIIRNSANLNNQSKTLNSDTNANIQKNVKTIQGNTNITFEKQYFIHPTTREQILIEDPNANAFYMNPVTKIRIWIFISRISDTQGYFIHPSTQKKITIQYSKLSPHSAFFKDPVSGNPLTIIMIRPLRQSVKSTTPKVNNQQTVTLQHKYANGQSQVLPASGTHTVTHYRIDPKTGKKIITKSLTRQINQSSTNTTLLGNSQNINNAPNGATNKKTISLSPQPRDSAKSGQGTRIVHNQGTHSRFAEAQAYYTHQKDFDQTVKPGTRQVITNPTTNYHQQDLIGRSYQPSQTQGQTIIHHSQNPPKPEGQNFQMTFKNFESFNKNKAHLAPHLMTSDMTDILISNHPSGPNNNPISPNTTSRKIIRRSGNSSTVQTRVHNTVKSPRIKGQVTPLTSTQTTRVNNHMHSRYSNQGQRSPQPLILNKDSGGKHRTIRLSNTSQRIETSSKLKHTQGSQKMDNYKLKRYGKRVNN